MLAAELRALTAVVLDYWIGCALTDIGWILGSAHTASTVDMILGGVVFILLRELYG